MEYPKMIDERVSRKKYGKVIVERRFQLPNRKVIDYFVWGGTTIPSIVFPVTPNNKVIALGQFRYAINDVLVELPGGCLSRGRTATAEETARNELKEETGYRAMSFRTLGQPIWIDPANCVTPFIPVLATGCQKVSEPNLDETEFAEVILYSLQDWISKIHDGKILDSKSIATTFLALPHLGVGIG